MTTITSVRAQPGRAWGILAIIAVLLPLPFLFALNVLSVVVRNQPAAVGGNYTSEAWGYGLLAFGGLFFFPVLFLLGLAFGIVAVTKPRPLGRVLGWIAIAVVILAIPALWFGYLVWIQNS